MFTSAGKITVVIMTTTAVRTNVRPYETDSHHSAQQKLSVEVRKHFHFN